jgi:UDP-N-acetylglucosamine 3-dehydrogenase
MTPPDERAQLSIVFLGCGNATRMHSRTLARVAPDVRRFYASRDRGRAEDFSRRHGGAGSFGSYREAMEAPHVDVVLIATPPASHHELTMESFRNGKHVIVEKPAFLRAEDVRSAVDAGRDAGRQLLVAENYFYKPALRRLREVLLSGDLGTLLFLHLNALKTQDAGDWRADRDLAGGGALFEGGVHWINFMANLGMGIRSVRGFRSGGDLDAPERSMLVVFDYEGGAVGTLSYSWEVHAPLKGIRLSRAYGTTGTVAFESNGLFLLQTGRRRRLHLPGLRDIAGYRAMFRDFVDALRTGRPPAFHASMAARDLELIETAYRTAGMEPGELSPPTSRPTAVEETT